MSLDLLVVGAGPAGLSLAAAAAEAGLRTEVLDPDPAAGWPANYGLWADEADALGLPLARRWARPLVHTDGATLVVGRVYGQLDRFTLRSSLLDRLAAAGGSVRPGRAAGAQHDDDGSTVSLSDGGVVRAALVCDCSGHRPALIARDGPPASAFQTAWGELLEVEEHPWAEGELAWMDFRSAPVGGEGPPTFLYALPLGPRRVFVEETALAARPTVPQALLRERLQRRLAAMGIRPTAQHETEWCVIPMDAPLPAAQRVVALGGAASMVHPATGYSVVASLSAAPAVVAALTGSGAPAERALRAWDAVWPAERRALWSVLAFGRETLLDLDLPLTHQFFSTFLSLPDRHWRPFLAGTTSPRRAGAAMLAMYARAPWALKARLSAAGLSEAGIASVGAMVTHSR
ncbi:MAG: lycopene cyclase family protein [Alphaproteobacteria bacterium]|nr:lycopene cyclase family protein [Alphaproteobacteria bacterium]